MKDKERVKPATISTKLIEFGQHFFVGREPLLKAFRNGLNQKRSWQILNIYGPTGIGKSTLIHQFQELASQQEIETIHLDINHANGSSELLTEQFCDALNPHVALSSYSLPACLYTLNNNDKESCVLFLDNYDSAGSLNIWLREQLLAHLPANCMVVISSRTPLEQWWGGNFEWNRLIYPMELTNLDYEDSYQYLQLNGVDSNRLIKQAWHYSDGLPLALSLIATVVEREGPAAINDIPQRQDVINQLVHYWFQEIANDSLKQLIEAASVVRRFNLDLLGDLMQTPVDSSLFDQLTNTSFVKNHPPGWALHELIRETLSRNLKNKSPAQFNQMRARALHYFGRMAVNPGSQYERTQALQELFYMLGDGLVKAAVYDSETPQANTLFMETASPADLVDIESYMDDWRLNRTNLTGTKIELYDRDSQSINSQWVAAETNEPELLNFPELITHMPGSVRLLRDTQHHLRGLAIIFPIHNGTIEALSQQPVTQHFFNQLSDGERQALNTPASAVENWFVRLVDVHRGDDHEARAALFRDLTAMLIRPARFITSTPLPFYQALLTGFGFSQNEMTHHDDFGTERLAPFFTLDLRGERFAYYLSQMIAQQTGNSDMDSLSPQLASMVVSQAQQKAAKEEALINTQNILFKTLTAREKQVALCAVEGLPNGSIAAKLNVTEVTIKKHMSSIFEKMSVRNRQSLMKLYWSYGQ